MSIPSPEISFDNFGVFSIGSVGVVQPGLFPSTTMYPSNSVYPREPAIPPVPLYPSTTLYPAPDLFPST